MITPNKNYNYTPKEEKEFLLKSIWNSNEFYGLLPTLTNVDEIPFPIEEGR